jgi:uncharacterized repeat protein (TIGR03803 family)
MARLSLLCLVAAGTIFAAILAPHAAAYRYRVLYSFCLKTGCPDGSLPYGGLLMDGAGRLYGTTSQGGGANNGGVAFELTPNATRTPWKETVLYRFCAEANCTDGRTPLSGLIMDGMGHLYGTTNLGGKNSAGVVFELTVNTTRTKWTEKVLYQFCSQFHCADGSAPQYGRLLMDRAGNLYGTTESGGNGGNDGVVFKLTLNATRTVWTETVLWAFCPRGFPCLDGGGPNNVGLIMDNSGNLYGTTGAFGSGLGGVVFKVTPHGSESVLYNFCSLKNCADGAAPFAGVIMDSLGNLYGTTSAGGAHFGMGAVYELTPGAGGRRKERLLYSFCAKFACADGAGPWAGLIMDRAGNLYGSTPGGGSLTNNAGVVFELARAATGFTEKVLHVFCSQTNCPDGEKPYGGVIRDGSGNLYGTTLGGGANGRGVVFELVNTP